MRSSQPGVRLEGQSGALCPSTLTPLVLALFLTVATGAPLAAATPDQSVISPEIDDGAELVQAHCSACHSLALVAQNRMSRDGWRSVIRWMQKKQGLWELGEAEEPILDYLERNHGVVEVPWRRKPLEFGIGEMRSE